MSNYTHDDQSNIPHHIEAHGAGHATPNDKPGVMSSGAFWFFIILAALFIAGLNFVKVMSHDTAAPHHSGHGIEHSTEAPHAPSAVSDTLGHNNEAHGAGAANDTAHSAGAH